MIVKNRITPRKTFKNGHFAFYQIEFILKLAFLRFLVSDYVSVFVQNKSSKKKSFLHNTILPWCPKMAEKLFENNIYKIKVV